MNGLTAAISGERDTVKEAVSWDFSALVHEHQSMVFSIAFRYLRNRAAAEEVAQEVFLQLHRQLSKLESREHVAAWLRKVACHRAIDYGRSRRFESQTSLADLPEPAVHASEADPMLRERLRRLVQSLPEKARLVMILRYQEDLDPEDISKTLDMPVRTVKSHLHRSLVMLREKVGRAMGESRL